MTRAEKFKEVFGLAVDVTMDCGFFDCSDKDDCNGCPVQKTMQDIKNNRNPVKDWWEGEYNGQA